MSPALVAIFFAAGTAAWLYSKFAQRAGAGNEKQAMLIAAVGGIIAFVVVFTAMGFLPGN